MLEGVSVIISTYTKGRAEYVLHCIDSLMRQSLPPVEVLLVLDPKRDLVEFYRSQAPSGVKVFKSDKPGLSNARNIGVKKATGSVVAFIDDDAVADRDWLSNLVVNYDDPYVAGVGGLVKPKWESKRSFWFPEELDWIVGCSYKGLPDTRTYVRNPIGCNMSFRKEIFDKVGCFRTNIGRFGRNLLAGEEPEFSLRVLQSITGSKIVYDPSAVVYHTVPKGRARLGYALKRSFYEGLSKAIIKNSNSNPDVLSREDAYLEYMIKVAIPSRLKRFYRLQNLCHILAIFSSMAAVLLGFSLGRLERNYQVNRK